MTSIGRQAAIGLCAISLAGTAGCAASPEYPIAPGQAPGDGALHMTERPHYPIGDGASRAGGAAPRGDAYPDPQRAAPSPAPSPPADEDADQPHAAPSAPVDSAPLPAPGEAGAHLDYSLAQVPPAFELAAYRHRRHTPEADTVADQAPADTTADAASHRGRRRSKAAAAEDAAQAAEETAPKDRRHPHGAASDAKAAEASTETSGDMPLQVTVKPGERLAQVAKRLHVSKQALMQVNGIDPSDHVKPGTVLKTPYRYAYQVQKGDTLYAIGHRFGEDTEQLAKLNALKHATELQPGQTIELPVAAQDEGAREHAHGDQLTPVGAPDSLIAKQSREERRAAAHEAALEARRERRGRHATQVAEAETPTAATEPAASEPERTASRRHRFVPPPTEMTSAHLAPSTEPAPTRIASREAEHPYAEAASAPAYTPPASTPPVSVPPASTPPYTPAARYTAPVSTASAARPAYGAPVAPVSTRPPVSVASEMAAEAGPGAASSPAVSKPSPIYASPTYASRPSAGAVSVAGDSRQTVASSETGVTSAARPAVAASTATVAPYRRPPAGAPGPWSYASPPSRTAEPGTYGGSSYAGSTAAGAPSRVASLNTPTYGGSIYGGPVLGRPRPVIPTAPGTLSNSAIAAAGQGRFVWPLRGAILEPFGDRGSGLRNDGLDIVAQSGESVHAAAGGEVVYAGSSIPGFGNLVLVKHAGGWVTAYAHLDRIEVRMRDTVVQGQEIGQAGQTGAVDRPQLHFEVRYAPQADEKARPVDPTLVLPGAG